MSRRKTSRYQAANLNNRVDVYTKQPVENDFGITEYEYSFYKRVFADLRMVRRKERSGDAETEFVITSHELYLRERSLPDIDETYRFHYKDMILQAKYIEHDFRQDGMIYVMADRVVK